MSGQDHVTQVMSGQVRSRKFRSEQDVSDHIMSDQVKSCQVWSRSLRLSQARSGNVMSSQIKVRPCRCCVIASQARSGQDKISSGKVKVR